MRFKDFIVREVGLLTLASRDHDGILAELVDALVRAGRIPAEQREEALVALFKREALGSTVIEKSIALPHARFPRMRGIAGCFAVAEDGVDFHASDGRPVTLFCFFLSAERSRDLALEAVAYAGRFLHDLKFQEALRAARTPEALGELLDRADEGEWGNNE